MSGQDATQAKVEKTTSGVLAILKAIVGYIGAAAVAVVSLPGILPVSPGIHAAAASVAATATAAGIYLTKNAQTVTLDAGKAVALLEHVRDQLQNRPAVADQIPMVVPTVTVPVTVAPAPVVVLPPVVEPDPASVPAPAVPDVGQVEFPGGDHPAGPAPDVLGDVGAPQDARSGSTPATVTDPAAAADHGEPIPNDAALLAASV